MTSSRRAVPIVVALATLLATGVGCPTDGEDLGTCEGLADDTITDYMGGKVQAEVGGERDDSFLASGLLTVTDAGGDVVQLQLLSSDEPAGKNTVTSLVVDCYQMGPIDDGVGFTAPIAEFAQAATQMQCWGWYDLLAADPVEGETAHYASDMANTGTFSLDASLTLSDDDGIPGSARGEFDFDAMATDGGRAFLSDGHFDVPVCRTQ